MSDTNRNRGWAKIKGGNCRTPNVIDTLFCNSTAPGPAALRNQLTWRLSSTVQLKHLVLEQSIVDRPLIVLFNCHSFNLKGHGPSVHTTKSTIGFSNSSANAENFSGLDNVLRFELSFPPQIDFPRLQEPVAPDSNRHTSVASAPPT